MIKKLHTLTFLGLPATLEADVQTKIDESKDAMYLKKILRFYNRKNSPESFSNIGVLFCSALHDETEKL